MDQKRYMISGVYWQMVEVLLTVFYVECADCRGFFLYKVQYATLNFRCHFYIAYTIFFIAVQISIYCAITAQQH